MSLDGFIARIGTGLLAAAVAATVAGLCDAGATTRTVVACGAAFVGSIVAGLTFADRPRGGQG